MTSLELEERYSRQVLFPGIGVEGQRKLANARIAIVGCGATGSALASLLARSGVGSYCATLNVLPGRTACLACLFPEAPGGALDTCETAGILNSAVNLAASLAATEALKLLTGASDHLRRTLLSFDLWRNQRAEI